MKMLSRHSSLVTRLSSLVTSLALAAATASATDGRYREYVIGERAGGMGGAAIAEAINVDALFYNPAGLSRSKGDSLSLSANLYGIEHYSKDGGSMWNQKDDSSSFVSIPGAMGGVKRLSSEWVGGFGVFTPKQEKRHLIASYDNASNLSHYDYNDQTLWIGPAIAWAPSGSRFSLGAGLFGIYRDLSTSENVWDQRTGSMSAAADLKTLGLLASVGAQLDLGDGWRVGATVQSPNVRVWDDGTISISTSGEDDILSANGLGIYSEDVEADNYIPWQFALGVGKTVPGKWGFAFDAIYHPSTHFEIMKWNFGGFEVEQTMHLRQVIDVSLGGEYIVAENYPIRAGIYTAMSAVRLPDDPESTDLSTSDVDMLGITFSVGRRSENMSVNLGIDYAFGDGHDLTYDDSGNQIRTSCDRDVFLATVSTTYYF